MNSEIPDKIIELCHSDLAHNHLGKINPSDFSRLTKLLWLNLTDNGIQKFTARNFGRNQLLGK